jgi:hypothetical protein
MRLLSNINLALSRSGVIDMGVYKVISDDRTLYIASDGDDTTGDGSSGGPWKTLEKVFDYLSDYRILDGVTVTVSVAAGTYTSVPSVSIRHLDANKIEIIGSSASSAAHAITGADNGTKTVEVAGDETATFPAGSVVSIMGSTDNDRTYTVDSVSHAGGTTTVTLDQAPQSSTADGTLRNHPASMTHIFEMDADAEIEVYGTILAELSGICIVGDSGSPARGLFVTQGGRIESSEGLVVRDCTTGIEVAFGSSLAATIPVVHGCSGTGVYCHDLSAGTFTNGALSCHNGTNGFLVNTLSSLTIGDSGADDTQTRGVASSNTSTGFYVVAGSYVGADYCQAVGNGVFGIYSRNDSLIECSNALAKDNTSIGIYAHVGSTIRCSSAKATYNGDGGVKAYLSSFIDFSSGQSTYNTDYGIYAQDGSVVSAGSATSTNTGSHILFAAGSSSSNTTNYSPAVDTVGNANSYIDT